MMFCSKSVALSSKVTEPSDDGLAGVHPVLSDSVTTVVPVVGAHPLFLITNADSMTLSLATVTGVSLIISSIGMFAAASIIFVVVLFLLIG